MARLPEHALTIRTYAEFRSDINKLADGLYNFLLVIGNSGLSKTRTVEDVLGEACGVISGVPTAWAFYKWCHDNVDKTLVLDDVGQRFYKHDHSNSLMKSLTDTRSPKTLHWPTTSAGEDKDYPSSFETTSRVIVLVNEWESLSEHLRAIEGRATTLIFDPGFMEVHRAVAEWFPANHQDVFDYIFEHRRLCTKPNMRLYVKGLEQKKAGSAWHRRTLEMMIGDERLQQIAALLTNPQYSNNTQRCKAFEMAGFGGSTTFYKLLAEFKNLVPEAGEENIKLRSK